MLDIEIMSSLKTVGVLMLYEGTLAFMIGPDNSGDRLGIVRLGGHIEENEDVIDALIREVKEEASISVKILSSPRTYYLREWDAVEYIEMDSSSFTIKPFIVKGDAIRSSAIFLSYAKQQPIPSSEAHGIIFLDEKQIIEICTRTMKLREFLDSGGKLIQQKSINHNMEIYAGVHLRTLYNMIKDNNEVIKKFLRYELL